MAQLTALLVSLLMLVLSISGVISTTFTIINECEYTVWPGIQSRDKLPELSTTGFELQKGESKTITARTSWSGRFWGRTHCSQDSTGKFSCGTGDCGSGKIECSGNGSEPPATLVEFTLRAGGLDFFVVSMVDGFNLPMKVVPQGGTGQNCSSAGCVVDLNDSCPLELKVTSAGADRNVACKSACMAFNKAEYCCTGMYSSPSTCEPSAYSQFFKSACPQACSYSYDDASTFTCASADYTISFCPNRNLTTPDRDTIPPDRDTIPPGQSLETTETIVSANGSYGLGFFSPVNSTKYYLVIYKATYWSDSYDDIVWVANREHPFPNSSAILTFNSDGNLVISDGRLLHVLTNTSSGGNDTYARLLNTGNLVLTNRASHIFWQSFDYPTDTLLPGMKLKDAKTGWSLTSNTSIQDPAPGRFSLHYLASRKELIVTEESEPYWISSLTGVLADIFVIDGDYITWPSSNYTNEDIRSIRLDVSGNFILEREIKDLLYWNSTTNGSYPVCAGFSICNEIPDAVCKCDCLPGFEVSPDEGCTRKTILSCSDGVQKDGFLRMSNVFLPTNHQHWYDGRPSECESACLNDCSCHGYAYDQKNRCLVWYGPLLNMKQFLANNTYTNDFYLKLARADLGSKDPGFKNQLRKIVIPTASIAVVVTLGLLVYYVTRRKLGRKGEDLLLLDLDTTQKANNSKDGDSGNGEVQMPLFSFASVSAATDNFSTANKLGEGGFGPVYKGILLRGNEVAVKRLSKRSRQGWEELKNEAMLIAKLQHKNLVRLLGCCIERDEKILIYEFMPNKSLDFFIFDREKRRILDWRTRVGVIEGIAQGLLYLHQYSRLKIIHRDLKPSNILLDIDMNPKISDFGMARIFGENESQANTNKIVGTYGYMSPEYALEGIFSIKSDVFSFGVLLLEIVSGRKNTGFYQTDSLHLIGYAWELWTSDRGSDLVDPLLDDISSMQMVLRYVNIAFLCVQERANDRPTMSEVIAMLSNESVGLPYPKEPAFLNMRSMPKANPVNSKPQICSLNGATISDMEGR